MLMIPRFSDRYEVTLALLQSGVEKWTKCNVATITTSKTPTIQQRLLDDETINRASSGVRIAGGKTDAMDLESKCQKLILPSR